MQSTIEHIGTIRNIDGNTAQVVIDSISACAACHARGACTASDKEEKIIDAAIVDGKFDIGETVVVIGQKSIGMQAVLLAYVLPFVLVIATMFVVNIFTENELVVGTAGLAILVPYLAILRLARDKIKARFQFYVAKHNG